MLKTGPLASDYHTALPDVPDRLKNCVTVKKDAKTADQVVLNQALTIEEQRACQDALLKWYADVQQSQAAKVSSAKPDRKPDWP